MAQAPVVSVSGTLEKSPLANILVSCLDRKLSGTLVLEIPGGAKVALTFEVGRPAKVRTPTAVGRLGDVLVEKKMVPRDVVEAAAAVEGGTIGQRLVAQGALDAEHLVIALRESNLRKLTSLSELPDTTVFGFYQGHDFLERFGGPETTPLDPLPLVWQLISRRPFDPRVEATIARLDGVQLKPRVRADVRRLSLDAKSRGVVDMLRARPSTLSELLGMGVASERETMLVVYTLVLLRCLELHDGLHPVDAAEEIATGQALGKLKIRPSGKVPPLVELNPTQLAASPPIPPIETAEITARRREILERARTIDKETYFAMLGIDPAASNDVMQSSYFALAKQWHPDRLPAELADVKQDAGKVFARISEAFQTLSDPERRRQYVEVTKAGGGSPEEQEKVAKILEAHMEFQKAEILLKKNDLAGALSYAARAHGKDPDQSDYVALLAWLNATHGAAQIDQVATSVSELDRVLKEEPNHQKALFYRGTLLKRIGQDDRAVKDFRKLLELDPKHLDATREVRLHDMRKGGKSERSKTQPHPFAGEESKIPFAGLFEKFKKK